MLTDNNLLKTARRLKVPDYVTADHIKAILLIIDKGIQDPDKPACDMVIEIAAGVPVQKAISHLYNKDEGSVYKRLYEGIHRTTPSNTS